MTLLVVSHCGECPFHRQRREMAHGYAVVTEACAHGAYVPTRIADADGEREILHDDPERPEWCPLVGDVTVRRMP